MWLSVIFYFFLFIFFLFSFLFFIFYFFTLFDFLGGIWDWDWVEGEKGIGGGLGGRGI